jgi:alanine dehydrogenase
MVIIPLIISNEEIEEILTMDDVLTSLEIAYRELGQGIAINRARSDLHVPTVREEAVYRFKTMEGAVPGLNVLALRLNSDIVQWPTVNGMQRQEKIPAAAGRWLGLIHLFSIETGELLAIMPDGIVQRMRVGGTNGLGAKYLSREDASSVGMIGSGWQAGAQLMALCKVRPIKQIKVYSPSRENRHRFAKEMSLILDVEVIPMDSPEKAIENVDIINTATNSMNPVFFGKWLTEGVHLSSIKRFELDEETFARADFIAINTREGKGANYSNTQVQEENIPYIKRDPFHEFGMKTKPELAQLVSGELSGRTNDRQITLFQNNIGLGTQFAAVAAKVYTMAKEKGVGRQLPLEWFTQTVHP